MIKVIVFDYAEVIAEGPMAKWVRDNADKPREQLDTLKNYSQKIDLGELNTDEVYNLISEITGIEPQSIWEKFYEIAPVNTDVINLIKNLKKNYKVFLFSNFIAEVLRKLLVKHGIENLFDEIIISSEYKMQKPNHDFFQILVDKADVKKDEILFIDDREKNIEEAKLYGIKAFQFVTTEQLISDLKNEGVEF